MLESEIMGLSDGEEIMTLSVLIQYRPGSNGQTDRHVAVAKTRSSHSVAQVGLTRKLICRKGYAPFSEPEIAPFSPSTSKTLAWNQTWSGSDTPFARYTPLNYTVTLKLGFGVTQGH